MNYVYLRLSSVLASVLLLWSCSVFNNIQEAHNKQVTVGAVCTPYCEGAKWTLRDSPWTGDDFQDAIVDFRFEEGDDLDNAERLSLYLDFDRNETSHEPVKFVISIERWNSASTPEKREIIAKFSDKEQLLNYIATNVRKGMYLSWSMLQPLDRYMLQTANNVRLRDERGRAILFLPIGYDHILLKDLKRVVDMVGAKLRVSWVW